METVRGRWTDERRDAMNHPMLRFAGGMIAAMLGLIATRLGLIFVQI